MLFRKTKKFPIGLDISDMSLKLVQLKKQGSEIKIQALNKVSLSRGIIENGIIKNEEIAQNKLVELINRPKFGKVYSNRVVACLPDNKTYLKLINISKNPNDLDDLIENEIQKYIPLNIKDIYYDWQKIKDDNEGEKVIIGAASKDAVNQYTKILDSINLSIEALEIEPISICRCLLEEEAGKIDDNSSNNYILVDIGATRTGIIIHSNNTIAFTISAPVTAKNIKDDKNSLSVLTVKLNEAIKYFLNNYKKEGEISNIILTGGGSAIKDIDRIISNELKIKALIGDPLVNFRKSKKEAGKIFKSCKILNNGFNTAIGLALRNIFIE